MKELAIDRPVKKVAGFMGAGVLCRSPVDVAWVQFASSRPRSCLALAAEQPVLLCTL